MYRIRETFFGEFFSGEPPIQILISLQRFEKIQETLDIQANKQCYIRYPR